MTFDGMTEAYAPVLQRNVRVPAGTEGIRQGLAHTGQRIIELEQCIHDGNCVVWFVWIDE